MFDFDLMKDEANRSKHGLPMALGAKLFEGPFVEEEDERRDYETRFIATGPVQPLDDRICVVVYTWRDGKRRLISFRRASDDEIGKYRASHA